MTLTRRGCRPTRPARCCTTGSTQPRRTLQAQNVQSARRTMSRLMRSLDGQRAAVTLPIPGGFTVYNAMTVIAIGPAAGAAAGENARRHCGRRIWRQGPGRGRPDTRDGLYCSDRLRPHAGRDWKTFCGRCRAICKGRVIAVFGCGGDRDPIKRPIMGRIGVENADLAVVTSDNPRTEDPEAIIADILRGHRGNARRRTVVIPRTGGRPSAGPWIMLQQDDIIVLAGKGHEDVSNHRDGAAAIWMSGRKSRRIWRKFSREGLRRMAEHLRCRQVAERVRRPRSRRNLLQVRGERRLLQDCRKLAPGAAMSCAAEGRAV